MRQTVQQALELADARDAEAALRASRARQILDDPLWIEVWTGMREGAVAKLAQADIHDTQHLQTVTGALQTLDAVRRVFEVWMVEGQQAARRQAERDGLEEQPGYAERIRRFARG
jgi:hypothetical protein